MKTRYIKVLLTLLMVWVALPMAADDYLKIYFKDGHTERHYMKLVENITVTKYDLEGNLHSDYQMQQIVMADTTYSYYLADIDSMSFKKVYVEQVKNNVEIVTNIVTPIFEQCSTIEELEEHINDIKNIEGVEDVIRSGTNIIVKVRDWYDFVFMYPVPAEEDNRSSARKIQFSKVQTTKPQFQQRKQDGTPIKVAIACQMINDSRFKKQVNELRALTDNFNAMGFEADFIPSNEAGNFDLDFYRRRMFDYDIVILDTHGCYYNDNNTKTHGFLTDEYLGISTVENEIWNWVDKHLDKYDLFGIDPIHIDIEDAFIACCRTGYFSSGVFIGVSENFIAKSKSKFREDCPHIVFCGACHSLEGDGLIEREVDGKTFTGSDAVAQIFHRKGADIYMGYNHSCCYSGYAASDYFNAMLNGFSHKFAFKLLDDGYKDENTDEAASLIDCTKYDSKYAPVSSVFLVNTRTIERTEQEFNNEYNNTSKIELKGKSSCYNVEQTNIQFGFVISTEPNVERLTSGIKIIESYNAHHSGAEVGEVVFSATFTPELNKTYYYRACTYDGNYNWGEERSFKISSQSGDSYTSCPDGNHPHMIDLGLPSGTKWACCNVGATTPEGYGDYFAWGETQPKDYYYWDTYIHCDGSEETCHDIGSDIAGTKYDAATANWAAPWQMPTYAQCRELWDKCTSVWTTLNGINGRKFTGPNGGTIFLPTAGYRSGSLADDGSEGYCWSSSLSSNNSQDAWNLDFDTSCATTVSRSRSCGQSIRPVRKN